MDFVCSTLTIKFNVFPHRDEFYVYIDYIDYLTQLLKYIFKPAELSTGSET